MLILTFTYDVTLGNTIKMLDCVKIILMSMYFGYTISYVLREINGNRKLQKHYNIKNNFTEHVIAPKYENTIQKLNDVLSYPLDIFKNKESQKLKHEYDAFNKLLLLELEGWLI
ncbi:MAG: hypothetical protein BZ136_08735 [Methanosphaera sp. rholeuAM74]|nr:MAG: hypothetical protein BZ136_08735 [Methanosphaera sp. rholeuAM74]